MALAGGIDLGGTKIEARLFDTQDGWATVWSETRPTPRADYPALVADLRALVAKLDALGAESVGLGAPGAVPADGPARVANLPADGHPFHADFTAAIGRLVPIVNDAQAFALSEATFGAGRGRDTTLGVVIGTGIAAGLVVGGHPVRGARGEAGEIGHVPMPHDVVSRHELPWIACGCGRRGCFETMCSGPGLSRIAAKVTGRPIPAEALAAADDADADRVLAIWSDVMAALLTLAVRAYDPDVIVLGGGVSRLPGLEARLSATLGRVVPGPAAIDLRLALGGDRSGARGAALFGYSAATGSS